MENYSLKQCTLTDGFWANRQKLNGESTIPSVYARFSETGRFKALKCKNEEPHSHIFWDSDVAKWLEAAAYYLARKPEDAQVRAWFDEAVNDIVENQLENGYFNSHYQVYEPQNIYTNRGCHELYCAGHIFEAAVAASEYLGDDRLLTFTEKYVDYIIDRFTVKRDTAFSTPGHEEIEIALCRLYELTGKEKYKTLAKFFIDSRGSKEEQFAYDSHAGSQSHLPVREQTEAVGHAVRAMYLYTAMADMAKLDRDEGLKKACEALFENIVTKKIYITGATGSSYAGERFSSAYDLPSDRAYAETCASIAFVFFCDRMLRLTGEAKYGHALERALYNGVLAGVSLDGTTFFYTNPLEVNKSRIQYNQSAGKGGSRDRLPIIERVRVFGCSCCPPNICRFFEEMPQYIWYADEASATLTLSQHISSRLQSPIADVELVSGLPTSGKLTLRVQSHGKKITLRVRKPLWCEKRFDNEKDGYLLYEDTFDGETIEIEFPLALKKVYPHPQICDCAGKVAITYGPIVLCAEGADNDFPLSGVTVTELDKAEILKNEDTRYALKIKLPVLVAKEQAELYAYEPPRKTSETLVLIPYFAWANRGENDMRVWFVQ